MKNILSILFRRKREAGTFALFIIIFPMMIAYMVTPKYESSASFLLTPGRFKKPFLPNEKNSQTGFVQVSMEDVASEAELMLSRPVVEKVVALNHLDVFPEPSKDEVLKWMLNKFLKGIDDFLVFINLKSRMPDFEVAVQKFIGDVDIEYVKRTNIITVEWAGRSPEQAQNVINTFIHEYIKQHIKVHGAASQAYKVIKNEVDENYKHLIEIEEKIQAIKIKNQFHDIDKERASALESYLEAKSKYDALLDIDSNNVAGSNSGVYKDDPNMVELINGLVTAKVQALELNSRYGKNDRNTQTNQKKIAEFAAIIKASHLKNLQKWHDLKVQYEDRMALLDKTKLEMDAINRQHAAILDRYQISLQKYNEALISNEMDEADIASVRIVENASVNTTPSYPKKMLLLFISVFFAIFGGIATAFAAEKSYSRIAGMEDVEEVTGLPVLFSFPFFNKKEFKESAFIKQALNKKLIAIKRFLGASQNDAKVHIVISPSPGVGSSFITEHLARFAYQQIEEPTLLLIIKNTPNNSNLTANTLEDSLDKLELKNYIKKENGISCLRIDFNNDHILKERIIKQLVEKLKIIGFVNIFIDIPNDQDDYTFINFLSSTDHVYINAGYDMTDKKLLLRLSNVIKEQTQVVPDGCLLAMEKQEIPEFINKRL